jgi:hypothetical protein
LHLLVLACWQDSVGVTRSEPLVLIVEILGMPHELLLLSYIIYHEQ